MTDELVERVVPADVLAQRDELTVGREARRRVEPAGRVEHGLRGAQPVGQRGRPPTGATVGPAPTGAHCCSTSSRVVLPQSPQLALATNDALVAGAVDAGGGASR